MRAVALGLFAFSLSVWLGASEAGAATCRSISQAGVTINLDSDYPCGQFANKEWYVVAPGGVTVTSMSPSYSGGQNGYEIDPVSDDGSRRPHSFDSRIGRGTDFIDPQSRYGSERSLQVSPTSVLVKVKSRGTCDANNDKSCIEDAVSLTVVGQDPRQSCSLPFRPPYAGDSKPIHCVDDVDWSLLGNVALLGSSQKSIPEVASKLRTPGTVWLDHGKSSSNRFFHPVDMFQSHQSDDAVDYGSEYSYVVHEMMTRTLQRDDDGTPATRQDLQSMVSLLVQLGIDTYHNVADAGMCYWADGGIMRGRMALVQYAGALLDDSRMKDPLGAGGIRSSCFSQVAFLRVGPQGPVWGRSNGKGCPPTGNQGMNTCEDPPLRDAGWPSYGCDTRGKGSSQKTLDQIRSSGCASMASYQVYSHQDLSGVTIANSLGVGRYVPQKTKDYAARIAGPPWNGLCFGYCSQYLLSAYRSFPQQPTTGTPGQPGDDPEEPTPLPAPYLKE